MRTRRVLITGAGSYIGMAAERWLRRPETDGLYETDTLDMRMENWREKDFSPYDAVLHVAGIAHRRETRRNAPLYYEVNRDLAIETARKAKREGIGQFILLSSMNVYGRPEGVIDSNTVPHPLTHYGRAKLQADIEIQKMAAGDFLTAIVRPPMVYGKECRGNYRKLSHFARRSPFFPLVENRRSMIHIDNLTGFLERLLREPRSGVFHPQNLEYVCTSRMVKEIAALHEHRIALVPMNRSLLLRAGGKTAQKMFGNLIYAKEEDICAALSFSESLRRTEL